MSDLGRFTRDDVPVPVWIELQKRKKKQTQTRKTCRLWVLSPFCVASKASRWRTRELMAKHLLPTAVRAWLLPTSLKRRACSQADMKKKRRLKRTLKSSRACAPRLSLRASALYIVCLQLIRRFCSSSASTRSEFQTMPRSYSCKETKKFNPWQD